MAGTLVGDQPMMRGAQRTTSGWQPRRGRAGEPASFQNIEDPDIYNAFSGYFSQLGENQATLEAGRQAAMESIGGLFESPTYQTLSSELQRRAAPGYSIVSPAQESAMNRQVALATTRARDERAQRLRAAGLSGSGMDIENPGLYTTIGSTGLAGVQAGIAAENAAAQERALAGLGSLGNFESAVTNAIAGLQANPVLSGYDPFLLPEMQFSRQQYFDEQAFEEAMMELFEKEAAFDLGDMFNMGLGLVQAFPGFFAGL